MRTLAIFLCASLLAIVCIVVLLACAQWCRRASARVREQPTRLGDDDADNEDIERYYSNIISDITARAGDDNHAHAPRADDDVSSPPRQPLGYADSGGVELVDIAAARTSPPIPS